MFQYNMKMRTHLFDSHKELLYRLRAGLSAIQKSKIKLIISIVHICFMLLTWSNRNHVLFMKEELLPSAINSFIGRLFVVLYMLSSTLFILYAFSNPVEAWKVKKAFERIGFYNHVGTAPILISFSNKENFLKYRFYSEGVSKEKWEKNLYMIENTLNLTIDSIGFSNKSYRIIEVTAFQGVYEYPDVIVWDRTYLPLSTDEIIIGESIRGRLNVSLNTFAHWLIAGETGSGKSVLLKLILMQCICHGHKVYIADFKGGTDYEPIWETRCTFLTDEAVLIEKLHSIISEIENRKSMMKGYKNIDIFYNETGTHLPRIIIGVDELAEVLDKSGASKERKEQIAVIESAFSTIARQGRAYGINLILSMQRPDANVLTGQIKSNIGYRICGRSDKTLSQIVIDSSEASKKVSNLEKGIFLTNNGDLFKSYTCHPEELL